VARSNYIRMPRTNILVHAKSAKKMLVKSSVYNRLRTNMSLFLVRRPHRSFQRTRRRDYTRSLLLPGYITFTAYVTKTLLMHKKLFGSMMLFYIVAGILLVGISSQDTYSQLSALLEETASSWSTVGQAGLLLVTSLSGGLNPSFTEAQQIYSALLLLLIWLAVVWSLRVIMAGNKPSLRDAMYNSGAPIVGTALVLLIIVVQLVPVALATVVVNSAIATGVFNSPLMSLVITLITAGLGLLSLYWVTSSFIALVVVTLPGMYPWRAIQTAGDLVIGRRIRILLRLLWMALCGMLFSAAVLLPGILIDYALKQAIPAIEWVPIVPIVMATVSSMVLIWSATYIYLLYRKIVEDDADPA
jgi:hypothetical protein